MYNKTIIVGRVKGNPERVEGKIGEAMRFTLCNATIGERIVFLSPVKKRLEPEPDEKN